MVGYKTLKKCKNEHDMRLTDVHLKGVDGAAVYRPTHGSGGLQLVKVYECGLCGQVDEVIEEIR